MPFIGLDWRAPGETWIKTQEGWERMKLRPYGTDRPLSELSLPRCDSNILNSDDDFCDLNKRRNDSECSAVEISPVVFVGGDSETDENGRDIFIRFS